MIFSDYLRYNAFGVLNICVAVFNLTLGGLVLSAQPKSPINRSFFLITVVAFQWMIGWGMFSLTRQPDYVWAAYAFAFGVPLISPSVYALSETWRSGGELKRQGYFGTASGSLLMFPAMVAPEAIFVPKEFSWGRYVGSPGTWFAELYRATLLVHFSVFAALAIWNFYRARKEATTPIAAKQARNIMIALIIAYIGAFDFLVWFGISSYPPGYIFLSSFLCFIAYSIFRYQTFDIDFAIRRFSLIVLVYSFLFAILVPISVPLVQSISSPLHPIDVLLIFLTAGAYAVVLSLGPAIYAWLVRQGFWLKLNVTTGITHELKSPLASIHGSLDVLFQHVKKGDPDLGVMNEYLGMIQRSADRLSLFVKNLLDIALIQESRVTVSRTEIDLSRLIEEELHLTAFKQGVVIESQLPPCTIYADSEKIRQVISNLLSNASKFTTAGMIRINVAQMKEQVICQIQDSGRGVKKKDLNRIFDRFFHGGHSNKGAGLGLAIAKAWVDAHGGRIWAESAGEGKGTTVTFTLPASHT